MKNLIYFIFLLTLLCPSQPSIMDLQYSGAQSEGKFIKTAGRENGNQIGREMGAGQGKIVVEGTVSENGQGNSGSFGNLRVDQIVKMRPRKSPTKVAQSIAKIAQSSKQPQPKPETPQKTPQPNLTPKTQTQQPSPSVKNPQPTPSSQPKPQRPILNTEFKDIGLYSDLPSTFALGQYFLFAGKVLNPRLLNASPNYPTNFVNIIFMDWRTREEFRCTERVDEGEVEFQISCNMSRAGTYYVSIFAGQNGYSTNRLRSVKVPTPTPTVSSNNSPPPAPQSLTLSISNNHLLTSWSSKSALTNLTISQARPLAPLKRQFLLSNYHQEFKIPFAEFIDFDDSKTIVEISHANSADGTLYGRTSDFGREGLKIEFEAIRHAFSDQIQQLVEIRPEIPWRMAVGEKLRFNATFNDDIRRDIYIIQPDKSIKKYPFKTSLPPSSIIPKSTPVSAQIPFTQAGTHILQINSASGMALINRPIYIGEGLPLIPDHEDMLSERYDTGEDPLTLLQRYVDKTEVQGNQTIDEPGRAEGLDKKRGFLLYLLNNLRKEYQVAGLSLDEDLNRIAQYHADDMMKNNYFSHTSLNGDGPSDRARKFNFTGGVGENIAQSNSLTQAHLGLQRSAEHLENSVSASWTRVGIGIAQTASNQYIVAFQFSTRDLQKQPLTTQQQQKLQKELVQLILQKNPNIRQQNKQLSQDITQWMSSQRQAQMFQYLTSKGIYRGPMIASSFVISYSEDVVDRLKDAKFLGGANGYSQVGVGLRTGKGDGMLESFIVFN